ncbi:helix-turn-helix transcriptional regulator [Streptomyces sp. TRM76323]|uniref:Helix-turn-helix transcriptional regulator n=1 Tax=Streptomyces tamarix TaxID=3078565 RepID=A0ABU3QTZ5_9ACTN|nr:helix-turn-helix transcriptional regulator [Streptomyces tamarix]MDT9686241.1 helix-turn-helix transcriptional regulator [Streptomyces tamarix]
MPHTFADNPPGTPPRTADATAPAAHPPATFADALRQALRLRGLPLQRVCDRLAEQGVRISPATLSHWQRGRSLPERPQSLRAVRKLEEILAVPHDHLVGLLQPHRPRGRARTHGQDVTASRRVFAPGSEVERALGDAFAHFNQDITPLSIHEAVFLGADRCIRRMSVTQVLRAICDGPDRLTLVHQVDEDVSPDVDFTVGCGTLGAVRVEEPLRCVVADILLGRRLRRGETAVVRYDVCFPPGPTPSTFYERRVRTNLREYLLHVSFAPEAVPASCRKYYRHRTDAPREQVARLVIDGSHTAHLYPGKCTPGVHGMSWAWPLHRGAAG